jgi:hypothetical protein
LSFGGLPSCKVLQSAYKVNERSAAGLFLPDLLLQAEDDLGNELWLKAFLD